MPFAAPLVGVAATSAGAGAAGTAAVGTIAAAGIGAAGLVMQGQAAKQQAENQETISEYNATVAENEARAAREIGVQEAQQFSQRARRLQARQRALFAASGVSLEGTPTELLISQSEELEFDRQQILRNASIRGESLGSRAVGERLQGQAAVERGRSALTGSLLQAGGQVTGAFGQLGLQKQRRSLIN